MGSLKPRPQLTEEDRWSHAQPDHPDNEHEKRARVTRRHTEAATSTFALPASERKGLSCPACVSFRHHRSLEKIAECLCISPDSRTTDVLSQRKVFHSLLRIRSILPSRRRGGSCLRIISQKTPRLKCHYMRRLAMSSFPAYTVWPTPQTCDFPTGILFPFFPTSRAPACPSRHTS